MTVALAVQSVEGPEIVIGYPWSIDLYVEARGVVLFPSGVALKAEVRRQADGPLLASLTTANGGLVRISDASVRIAIAATDTAAMQTGMVSLDLVRTDVSPVAYVGVRLTIPVAAPITRP